MRKKNNPVAKFSRKFNKGRIFRDRKKEAKKRGYYNKSEKRCEEEWKEKYQMSYGKKD